MHEQERRSAPRKPLRVGATLHIAGRPSQRGRTSDISTGGLQIRVDDPVPIQAACRVEFSLSVDGQSRPLDLNAKVAYSMMSQGQIAVGLAFVSVSAQQLKLIEQYMARGSSLLTTKRLG